jgi:cytochrome c peroxidase
MKANILAAARRLVFLAVWLLSQTFSMAANADRLDYVRPDILPPPLNNATTAERVELGRALFFDPRLSGSNWISCATCHNPGLGWADGLPTGIGNGMESLPRSTPTVLNTAYNKFQFWDGRARTLEEQALAPIVEAGEMHQDIGMLVEELAAIAGYVGLFEQAYPAEGITESTISRAIAAYERTLITTDAPFDLWVGGDETAIDDAAKRGFELFEGKARCAVCHHGFNFQDDGFHNIGLTSKGEPDPGRYAVRPIAAVMGAFKTPTLRELARTAPYMHDGSYVTLRAVLEHYNRGGDVLEGLSPQMRPLDLTADEIDDLLAFLDTLNSIDPLTETIPILPQ